MWKWTNRDLQLQLFLFISKQKNMLFSSCIWCLRIELDILSKAFHCIFVCVCRILCIMSHVFWYSMLFYRFTITCFIVCWLFLCTYMLWAHMKATKMLYSTKSMSFSLSICWAEQSIEIHSQKKNEFVINSCSATGIVAQTYYKTLYGKYATIEFKFCFRWTEHEVVCSL